MLILKANSALGNRPSTQDLDYFLDATAYGPMHAQVKLELRRLIHGVADRLQFVPDWANDQVELFLSLLRDPKDLFDRSIKQNLVLYRGDNIHIYAVLWLWVLVRKMKRLQMEGEPAREVDWIDCVSIIYRIKSDSGTRLKKSDLTEFDHTDREPPVYPETAAAVNQRFRTLYGSDGLVD